MDVSALEADALRSFAVFARHANFTRAAEELHISQPSLHVKITKLAGHLGVDLYEREGRGLILTPAGQRLATFAADSQSRTQDFLSQLHGAGTSLAVATGRGALRWVIGDKLRALVGSTVHLDVLTADRNRSLELLMSGTADLAVLAQEAPPDGLESKEIASFPQVLMIGEGEPLSRRRRISLSDLDGLDLVLPPKGRQHRRALTLALGKAGATCNVTAEVDGWDLLVHMASLGLGATVVNGCVPAPPGMCAVPVRDLPPVSYWAAWRQARRHRAAMFLGEAPA